MNVSGLFYILGEYGFSSGSVVSLYDFSESGSIPNKANLAYSGVLAGDSGSFWQSSGYASFDAHSVVIDTGRNILLDNLTVLLVGSGSIPQTRESLFSNALTNSSGIASGICIYRNNIGNLSLGLKDCSGVQTIQSTFSTIGPFAVGVSKQNADVQFFSYDYNTDNVKVESFTINNPNDIFPSVPSFLGKNLEGYISGIPNSDYKGRLDWAALISGGIDAANAALFFSGAYQDISGDFTQPQTGNLFEGFWNNNVQSIVATSYSPPEMLKTKTAILLLSQSVSNTDLVTCDLATEKTSNINKQILFSTYLNAEVLQSIERGGVAVWLNGQRLISGTVTQTGSFCQRGTHYPQDYDIRRNVIISPIAYNSADLCVYDAASPSFIPQAIIGSGTDTFTVNLSSGFGVFINGVRTYDFGLIGDTISFDFALSAEDKVCIDYFDKGKWNSSYSGQSQLMNIGSGFYDSCVYLNGQRLLKDIDYIEIYTTQNSSLQFGEIPSTNIFETKEIDETYDS